MASNSVNKKRSENFSADETLFLVEQVEKHIELIKSKHTNQVTNVKKAAAWREITEAVNSRGGIVRTVDQIKEKYRKACSKAKGEIVSQKTHRMKTGGGPAPPPVDAISQKILDVFQDAPNFVGIEGGVEVGGLVFEEVPLPATTSSTHEDADCSNPVGDEALVTAANNLEKEATQTIVELPDNLTGTSVTYDLMISESGAKIKKKDEKEKGRKRKNEESVAELQRLVLKEDLRRIREETELIILQKEKVALEILKLKLETSSLQTENEM